MPPTETAETLPLSPWRESLLALAMLAAVWLAMGLAVALALYLILPAWQEAAASRIVEGVVLVSALGTVLVWLAAAPLSRRWLGVRLLVRPADARELHLLMTVRDLARRAGLPAPRVGVIDSPLCNAFTLGFGRRSACIVVGRELLDSLDDGALAAIVAHELAHILNGDLRTLTWINGAVNMVTVQPARLVGWLVDRCLLRRREPGPGYYGTLTLMQLGCGWLASLLSGWFSRQREFDADRTAARLVGAETLAAALETLRRFERGCAWGCAGLGMAAGWRSRVQRLLDTHPDLDDRIRRLARVEA